MNTKKYLFFRLTHIFLLLWLLSDFCVYSQNGNTVPQSAAVSDALAEQLHSLSKDNASDLVYLQTSKTIYETEEDVWFKGYVLDAQFFLPSGRSKILFVQLIEDKTDQVVWEKKYEIENGFVNGHLFLDSSLPEGTYTMAAYSSFSYTKNTREFYAIKKLEILKTINRKAIINSVQKDSILQFATFAEGGNLVSGIPSTMAFKAVNSNGLPVNVSGTLYENDRPLVAFKSTHAGMGSFVFTPDANKKYHIQLTTPASEENFSLAKISQNGKILQLVNNTKEALTFKITQSSALQAERVYLRLQVRGIVYSIASGLLKNELSVRIPLKDVPQGIAEVTLFNGNTVPLAERLVYVKQDQKLYIKTELNKKDYGTREKVNLKIKVSDEKGQPLVAHLGLSVYDRLYQNKQDSKNILTHYFLSTQLKGNIYNPDYYFDEKNKDRIAALDLLLLTQGWRSYVWEETNLKEFGTTLKPIVFDELKGKVIIKKADSKVNEPLPQVITIFAADGQKETGLLMIDDRATFIVTPDDSKKGKGEYAYLKLIAPPQSKYRMHIKDFSFEEINKERKIKTALYPIPTISETKTEVVSNFAERPEVNKLKEVLITSKKNKMFRDKYIGKLDSLAKLNADYVCSYNILNCPNHWGEINNRKPIEGEIYGMPNGIKTGPYHYPNYTEVELLDLFNIVKIKGFYGKKVFYEPFYDAITINDPLPDYRNTLFWKPDMVTNEQGEADLSFFCSDINTIFSGNIEGVGGDGLLGAGNFEISVKKNKI
ncbi:hypothetical protein [Flavobacterium aquidurense]|uniref:hypothetical protein n=1 Tax=Flavobacterium aquidurense TaxID=362413 RepID=UPI002858933B|nr:hypothetical protein [Flavobacterium aquidurense]MDR7371473.1 hypothetical protein [Flavobacterium aquidurense]